LVGFSALRTRRDEAPKLMFQPPLPRLLTAPCARTARSKVTITVWAPVATAETTLMGATTVRWPRFDSPPPGGAVTTWKGIEPVSCTSSAGTVTFIDVGLE